MSNGVPDIVAYNRLSRAISSVKTQAETARTESVTGRYSDLTAATKGDIGGAHLLHKAIMDSRAAQKSLSLAESRLTMSQSVLKSVSEDSTRIGAGALNALASEGATMLKAVAADADGALKTVFSALNTTVGGRALFAGDAGTTPPMRALDQLLADVGAIVAAGPDAAGVEAALDDYFNDPAGVFETDIYNGGDGAAPEIEIAPGVRIDAAVKANAQPIKDLIRGLTVLANAAVLPAGSQAESRALLADAAERVLGAETNITDMQAVLGVAEGRVQESKTRHENEELVLSNLYNSKTARDPFDAAAQVQLLENQLEMSYILTGRLSSLNLANYLR